MTDDLLAIVGPTASGKTELALKLAQDTGGELISVDSRQVYRDLSVGTAKPQGEWKAIRSGLPNANAHNHGNDSFYVVKGIPYHLVDIWDPAEPFTAADFVRLATEKINQIRDRGKKPIFVGGTGLYLKALTEGLAPLPPRNDALRQKLRQQANDQGRTHLHAELAKVDAEAAAKIPANNIQRVIRALEVYHLTGKPLSHWHQKHQHEQIQEREETKRLSLHMIGINLPKEELHQRIETRGRWMWENGILEETKELLDQKVDPFCPALSGLGYPRVIAYLQKKLAASEALALFIQDTRQYAKRQMTWFRHQARVDWRTGVPTLIPLTGLRKT